MQKITVLSKGTVDQIAAGEVIERPASIVKELVENSIDAGANAVTVEIRDGGISFIRITDNGSGIEKDEVPVAFLRHATSKIRTAEDLQMLHTLGFRGEALSSIAAVSQVEVITKSTGSLTGLRYVIEGGEEKESEEIGAPEGTTFLVRNLFYNTPARQKFLKSPVTEAGYVSELMERLALSRPEVSFKFLNQGKLRMHTAGNGKQKDIIYNIYGKEIAANLLALDTGETGQALRIRGYVGKPSVSRGNRNYENYYVNGRFVRSTILSKAIEEAYKPFLMNHRYPFTVLFLTIDTTLMDANVHPTKLEVRFSDQMGVYEQLYQAVKDTLAGKELIPEVSLMSGKASGKENGKNTAAPHTPRPAEPFEQNRRNREENANLQNAALQNAALQSSEYSRNTTGLQGKMLQEERFPYGAPVQNLPFVREQREESGTAGAEHGDRAGTAAKSAAFDSVNSGSAGTRMDSGIAGSDSARVETDSTEARMDSGIAESASAGVATNSTEARMDSGIAGSASAGVATDSTEARMNSDCARTNSGAIGKDPGSARMDSGDLRQAGRPSGTLKMVTGNITTSVRQMGPAGPSGFSGTQGSDLLPVDTAGTRTGAEIRRDDQPSIPTPRGTQMSFEEDERLLTPENRKRHRLVGQVFDTFWIVEFQDKMYIIDQHAAHEKVLFERFMKEFREKRQTSQQLSPPLVLTLSMKEEEMLERFRPAFEEIGFEMEPFGGRSYAIRAVPGNLYGLEDQDLFMELLDSLTETSVRTASEMIHDKVATMACKAAVKGNNRLSPAEADALITELLTLENPYHCPHGRPTIISMSHYELDKKFRRVL